MPEVSVVIPTYNRAVMVREAIESVLSQTFRDSEVIVVDDGSTDGTGEVLRRRCDERVRCYYQENSGRSVARNRGIQESVGKYVLFLDSDDWLLPHALEVHSAYLDAHPEVDVVYSDGYYCDAEGQEIERISLGRPPVNHDRLLETMVLTNIVIAPHSAMVRRTALQKLGYPYFDETLHGPEDSDLWLRLTAQGARFACLDTLTCMYRIHDSNSTLRWSPDWERHRHSLVRFNYKTLHAAFFATLSPATRRQFLYELLLVLLGDDIEAQEEILRSPQFLALPPHDQAHLLYYVGVENIAHHRQLQRGRSKLRRAVVLAPRDVQYRAIWYLSRAGQWAVRAPVSLRRKLGGLSRREGVDYKVAPHARPDWQRGGR